MTPALEQRLIADYPKLLGGLWRNIECDDGWEPLIRQICEYLTQNYDDARADIIKEKFGGLRFGIHCESSTANYDACDAVAQFENESFHICEVCGKPGSLRKRAWWKTRCEEHA